VFIPSADRDVSDGQQVITLLENQIADLKAQLELSQGRETAWIDERSKLINLVYAEKAEKWHSCHPSKSTQLVAPAGRGAVRISIRELQCYTSHALYWLVGLWQS